MTSKGLPFLSAAASSSGKELATVNSAALATVALATLEPNNATFNQVRREDAPEMALTTSYPGRTLAALQGGKTLWTVAEFESRIVSKHYKRIAYARGVI